MKPVITVVIFLVMCLPVLADYPVFTDNFDDGDWTNSPKWEANPEGPVTVSSERSTSGQYSLKVASDNELGAIRASSGLGLASQSYSSTFNLYVQSMGDEAIPWCLQNSSGGVVIIVFILPGGTVQLSDLHGEYSNVPTPLTYGQWHSFRLTYDGLTTNLYLDGHQTPDASIAQTYVSNPVKICVGNFVLPHTSTFYVDDLTIRADIQPAKVYVQMCSDTSVSGLNTNEHYNAFSTQDQTYVSPTGNAAQVMAESYRNVNLDSLGNKIKFTWYMLGGSMYSCGVNTGPLLPYELMVDNHADEIARWGDEMAFHYHTWLWYDMDGDGVDAWDAAPDFSYCIEDFDQTVAHFVLDRGFYPCSFRSGWHYMDNIFQRYLDDWYPYRFENSYGGSWWTRSPAEWVPYHPDPDDYQSFGSLRGWESRCLYMKSFTSSVVEEIFASAQAGTPQLVTAWSHLQETDFPAQASDVGALLSEAHDNFPLVDFEYFTGRECMLKWRNGTDVTPPIIELSTSDDDGIRTAVFSTHEAIYQIQPFVARKSIDGTYSRMDCTQVGPNQWSVEYDVEDTALMAVAATDWFGNAGVRFMPVQFVISDISTSVASDSALIRWKTNTPADTTIEYGLAFSGITTTLYDAGCVLVHQTTLTDLLPGRVYRIKIRGDDQFGQHAESADVYILTRLGDEIVIDNVDAEFSVYGSWNTGNSATGRYGDDYRWAATSPSGTLHADWAGQVTEAGLYRVYAWWSQGSNRSTQARYSVWHDGNEYPTVVNQQINGGQWNVLGTYDLNAGDAISVQLSNNAPSGYVVIADAVRIERAYIPASSIGLARLVADGNRVELSNVAVTAVFGSEFYVEEIGRSAGLRVSGTGDSRGDLVTVSGEMSTSAGERVILNPIVEKLPGAMDLDPLMMTHRRLDPTGKSITASGLLISVTGGVTFLDVGHFYLDDGSGIADGTGQIGLRVDDSCLSSLPDVNDHIVVTGILSAAVSDGKALALLRPRDSGDIIIYQR